MKRIHSTSINNALLILSIIALYIILAIALIPSIRIPSCLSEDNAQAINKLLLKLSLAYISAYLFYYLTVTLKDKLRRDQQKWIVYDSMNMINDRLRSLLNYLRIDKKSDNESTTEELGALDQNECDTLKNDLREIHKLIRHELLSGIIWLDDEIDCLSDIDNSCVFLLQFDEFRNLNDKNRELAVEAVHNLYNRSNKLTRLASTRQHAGTKNPTKK